MIRSAIKPYWEAAQQVRSRNLRELGWIVAGQIAAALGGFVGFRILSGHLTPALWGQVLLWQTFALLVNQVIVGGLAAAMVRYAVLARDQGEFDSLLLAIGLLMAAALGLVAAVVATVLVSGWAPVLGENARALLLVSGLGVTAGVAAIADSMQNAFRHRATVALHQAAGQWLRFLVATGLLLFLAATKEAILAGFLFGSSLVLVSQFLFARPLLRASARRSASLAGRRIGKWCRTILVYAWPFVAWGVLNWLQTSVERWIIERSLNAHDLGIYGAASQLSIQPMTMFWSSLMQLLSPIAFRIADAHGNFARARLLVMAAAIATALLGVAGAGVAQCFGSVLAGLFVGPQFLAMTRYWPAMLIVAGLSGAGQVLSVYGMIRHRTNLLVFPRVAAAVVAIGLSLTLVPRMGLAGAIAAAGSAALVLCLLNARLFQRLSHAD